MNVLSVFDGMSCGRIALERAGINVKNYFASEIDKYTIQIAKKNYPDTIHVGDVTELKGSDIPVKIDLLIGGSPCQGFSFAQGGKELNFDDPRSRLFFEFVRLLKECKPKYFLLENVRMNQKSQDVISRFLDVEPIAINSNLVSAQNRYRLYWTNIPFNGQPEDKGILLKDILEDYHQIGIEHFHTEKSVAYMQKGNDKWMKKGKTRADRYTQTPDTKKSFTLTANIYKGVPYNYFEDNRSDLNPSDNGLILAGHADLKGFDSIKRVYHPDGKAPTLTTMGGGHREPKVFQPPTHYRKLTPLECERLQTIPDNYTEGVSNTQRYKMIGNGWTVDVITHILSSLPRDTTD